MIKENTVFVRLINFRYDAEKQKYVGDFKKPFGLKTIKLAVRKEQQPHLDLGTVIKLNDRYGVVVDFKNTTHATKTLPTIEDITNRHLRGYLCDECGMYQFGQKAYDAFRQIAHDARVKVAQENARQDFNFDLKVSEFK